MPDGHLTENTLLDLKEVSELMVNGNYMEY